MKRAPHASSSNAPADRTDVRRVRPGNQLRLYVLWVAIAAASGVALRSSALEGSLFADDWDQYAMQAGIYPLARGPLDLFDFVGKGGADRRALVESGRLPWWTAESLELAVFRPLSSALVHLDYAVLDAPIHPVRAHLHSMFWWVTLVCGVGALLARLLPLPAAGLAVLLYALDEAHSLPVVWSANRSELIAVSFVLWGLWARLVGADRGSGPWRALSLVLVALGLLAGEHALAPLAYFAAFELAGNAGSIGARLRALAPVAALTAIYLIARTVLGYGVAGSTFYIDPVGQPWRYLVACASRVPLLLGDLTLGYAAEWSYWEPPWRHYWLEHRWLPETWLSLPHLQDAQRVAGLLVAVGVLGVLVAFRRTPANDPRRRLHWLLLGATISLVPVSGALPMSRLTVAPAVGFDAALGWLLWHLFRRAGGARGILQSGAAMALALPLLSVHLVYAGVRGRREVTFYALRSRVEEAWVMQARLDPRGLAERHVLLISSRDLASQWALPFIRHRYGLEMPRSSQLLTAAFDRPHRLLRVAPEVLDIQLPRPALQEATFRVSPYRLESSPFQPGDRFDGVNFHVEIIAAEAGEPTHLRFIFRAPLEDGSYAFLYAMPTGLERLQLPPVGQAIELPAPSWPSLGPPLPGSG